MNSEIIHRPSPNFDERDVAIKLEYVVLHYTGMPTRDEALRRLCDPNAKVSAHYLIDEEGIVYHLVNESNRAWHAGKSYWREITDINSASIGIELVNPGHEFGYRPFSKPQVDALIMLLKTIVARHKLNPTNALLAHSDVAPARKQDPGELFPWKELAKLGLGIWPDAASDMNGEDKDIKGLLHKIGYGFDDEKSNTTTFHSALLAFQRRYVPHNLTGVPNEETIAKASEVARMLFTNDERRNFLLN